MASPSFYIRDIPVYGDLVLAPMDGFSDRPFRSLCRQLGSALSYTEFMNAMDISPSLQGRGGGLGSLSALSPIPYSPEGLGDRGKGHADVARKLAYFETERPVIFQIFDSDPVRLLDAALHLQELGPDAIDINMGCSVRCVSGRGAGAGLLREPQKIAAIFNRLSLALDVPVTGKIRLGWDDDSRNYLEVARVIEESGGSLLAVHGRTRAQGYGGAADWDAIAEIKQALSIPVIGNGDVRTVADIARLKAHTGCDAVMIGRGAVGNPWIFSRLDREQVPPELARRTLLEHLERMLAFYGAERGLVLFRKHASRYLSPYPLSKEQRQRLLTAEEAEEFLALLDENVPQFQ